jgi:ADP-ribose pyrophosphatase YjhB (NUDIX family)
MVRFPPADGTVCPMMDEPSNEFDLKVDDHMSREEITAFWSSQATRQSNGLWKGGSWGLENLIIHSSWCNEAFIGDKVEIEYIKNGVLPFKRKGIFDPDENTIIRTSNSAWSCNITIEKTGQRYCGYAMNYFMPQYSNDLLFVWNNTETNKRLVKICKRGSKPSVDMQNKLMPGAGEHLEPGEHFRLKSSIIRAFREELGVSEEALEQCYLLDLGKFDDPGRDPRYWTFYYEVCVIPSYPPTLLPFYPSTLLPFYSSTLLPI